jgi:hypothetical protein
LERPAQKQIHHRNIKSRICFSASSFFFEIVPHEPGLPPDYPSPSTSTNTAPIQQPYHATPVTCSFQAPTSRCEEKHQLRQLATR